MTAAAAVLQDALWQEPEQVAALQPLHLVNAGSMSKKRAVAVLEFLEAVKGQADELPYVAGRDLVKG